MIRKLLYIAFLLTLAGALGMIVLDKLRHEIAMDRCVGSGGRWNYMVRDGDRVW